MSQSGSEPNLDFPRAMPIRTILVPQGAEYRAVQKGCKRAQAAVTVVPLPMGHGAGPKLRQWLKKYKLFANAGYLLLGLGGGLSLDLHVGDWVLCETVRGIGGEQLIPFDAGLNRGIYQHLPGVKTGQAVGCDRIITSASQKQTLHQKLGATVVEMESLPILRVLQPLGKRLAMVRVISDDCRHDLPDISDAVQPDGSLRPLTLATQFMRQPIGAGRLIYGSLKGLARLETLAYELLNPHNVGLK